MKIYNRSNRYFLLVISFFFIIFVSLFFIGKSLNSFYKNEIEIYKKNLEHSSVQQSSIIENHLKNNMKILESAAGTFIFEKNLETNEIIEITKNIKKLGKFDRVFLIKKDGEAIFSTGDIFNISEKNYFKKLVKAENEIAEIKDTLFNENTNLVIVSVPIIKNNRVEGAICGTYRIATFSSILYESIKEENGFVLLLNDSQEFILNFSIKDKEIKEKNMWEFLSNVEIKNSSAMEKVKHNILDLKSGFLEYSYNGKEEFAYYTPLGINNWYVISITSALEAQKRLKYIEQLIYDLSVKILIAFILGLIPVAYFNKKIKEELELDREIFHIAMDKTSNIVFEYNKDTKTILFKNTVTENHSLSRILNKDKILKNIPESLIENNYICEESISEYLKMFEKISNPEMKSVSGVLRVNNKDYKTWERLSLTNILDKDKNIICTVGVVENVTEEKENEQLLFTEKQYREVLMEDNSTTYEVNISKNLINLLNDSTKKRSYDEYLEDFTKEKIFPDDIENIKKICSRENMIRSYNEGKTEFKLDYRIKDKNGNYKWEECKIRLVKKLDTEELKGIVLVKDISNMKELIEISEKDSLTALYNRRTIKIMIEEALSKPLENEKNFHAFLLLDLDNFKTLNDRLGHIMGDSALKEVADKLEGYFKENGITGRLGGDEFIVFIKNLTSVKELTKILNEILKDLSITYTCSGISVAISASIGVTIVPKDGKSFQELYRKSDIALYYVKNNQKNSFAFYKN
ncbi:putative diguanylate cyclase [Fusobacterium varium]|nr:putative diguanylate cyclase [Fusobacterium varium]